MENFSVQYLQCLINKNIRQFGSIAFLYVLCHVLYDDCIAFATRQKWGYSEWGFLKNDICIMIKNGYKRIERL